MSARELELLLAEVPRAVLLGMPELATGLAGARAVQGVGTDLTVLVEAARTGAARLSQVRAEPAQADGVAVGVGEHADPCLRRDLARGAAFGRTGRVMQRANDGLGTNWTVHDLRPTAGARMVAPTTIWAYRATGSLSSTEGGEHVREADRTLTVPGPRPLLGHSLRSGLEGPEYAALVLSVA